MAYSKITIVFNNVPNDSELLNISESKLGLNLLETFKESRLASKQVKIPAFVLGDEVRPDKYIGYTSTNYGDAFNLDYNSGGLFTVTNTLGNVNSGLGTITIEAKYADAVFAIVQNTTTATVTIVNSNQQGGILIDSIAFAKYTASPGERCLVNVTTSRLASDYYLDDYYPPTYIPNTVNPFQYNILRGTIQALTVRDSDGNINTINVEAPAALSIANTYVNIVNTPQGGVATATFLSLRGLTMQYSLDGTTWQSSNVFSGLLPGNYTLIAKDQFDFTVSKTFTLTAFVPSTSVDKVFSYLSKAMSIRFKKDQLLDHIDICKTDDNTLSCEEQAYNSYRYIQKFKPTNVITTQFLSNYSTIEAKVLKADGTLIPLIVNKKISFLDIKDKRDARMYSISGTQVGVYFASGNIYDYNSASNIISSYALNGALPGYGLVGNYVNLNGDGWYKIVDIIYNESLNADVLVFDYTYSGVDYSLKVWSNYNQKNFNVYEFTIDFSVYVNENIQVKILQKKTGFEDFNYLSEVIEVSDYFENSVELIWYNKTDSLVFYSTGIKNLGNFEFTTFESSSDSGLEIHKTPQTSIVIDSNNYELKTLLIEDLSTGIMQQLVQASLHKQIFVNKVKYVSSENPDTEVIKFTNMHSVTLNLIKTGDIYNSDLVGGYGF